MDDTSNKIISSENHFQGKVFNVRTDKVLLDLGFETNIDIVEHKPAVSIVPIDENERLVMVRQYRHPASRNLLEIPAGIIEDGETPEQTALRELQEETGYTSKSLRLMTGFWSSPGFTNEYMYTYIAKDLIESKLPQDEDEDISIEKIPLDQVERLIKFGEIEDAKSIASILMAKFLFNK